MSDPERWASMNPDDYSHLVGRTIMEVIVATPDRPVSMSSHSESACFLRLDNDVFISIGCADFAAVPKSIITALNRDRKLESEFTKAVGSKILGVNEHDLFITDDMKISIILGQFWIRPVLEKIK